MAKNSARRDLVDRLLAVQRGVRMLEKTKYGEVTALAETSAPHPNPIAEWLCYPGGTPGNGWCMGAVASRLWAAERRSTQKDIHRQIQAVRKELDILPKVYSVASEVYDPRLNSSTIETLPNGLKWNQQYGQNEAQVFGIMPYYGQYVHPYIFPNSFDTPAFFAQSQIRTPVGFNFSSSTPDDTWNTSGGPAMQNYSYGAYYFTGPGIPAMDPSGAVPAGYRFGFIRTPKGYNSNPTLYGTWVPDDNGWAGVWFQGGQGYLPGFSMAGYTDGNPSAPGYTFSYDDNQMKLNVGPGEWEFGQASAKTLLPAQYTGRKVGGTGNDGRPYSRPLKNLSFPFIRDSDLRVPGPPIWFPSIMPVQNGYGNNPKPPGQEIPDYQGVDNYNAFLTRPTFATVVAGLTAVLGKSAYSGLASWVDSILSDAETSDAYEHDWKTPTTVSPYAGIAGGRYPGRVAAARVGNTVVLRGVNGAGYGSLGEHFWQDKRLAVKLPNGGTSQQLRPPRRDGAYGQAIVYKDATGLRIGLQPGTLCDSIVLPALYPEN